MWSSRHVLDSLLWEAAVDDMGIYPRAVLRGTVEERRTEWQDGWNAAVMGISEKHEQLTAWAKALTADQLAQVQEMLDADGEPINLGIRDKAVTMVINTSDTFMYACSDVERFDLADLPEIHRLWKAHGYCGLVAWIARKRHAEPVKEYRYDSRYIAAKADL